MTDGPDGQQPLYMHARSRVDRARRGPPITVFFLGLIAICAGAGAFYFKKLPLPVLSAVQTNKSWVLPEGTPSMGEAQLCLRNGDLPCAEADMLAYLKSYPNDAHATALLAITLTQDGHHREALYYYKRADALGVATYDFYAGYARTLDAMGDTDGAIEKNQAALKLVPSLVDVRGALADELVRKGRKQEALELLTSFDANLEAQGYPPYFTQQIARIRKDMGGDTAKEASGDDASPAQAVAGQTLVRGKPDRGTLAVPVSIDGAESKFFTIDSGASMLVMPEADAGPLLKLGPGDYKGMQQIELANGAVVMAKVYTLRSVKVGEREVSDVAAAVYPGQGPRLLGQSFLKRFKSWSIDNDRRVLVLNE
ncbi:MAG TPA: retroviral-like aspartic protease family protein [Rhizomicrobium sp.]|nr:retroviral-like aspartic protease family protein [Rhizomicrobium sp.]